MLIGSEGSGLSATTAAMADRQFGVPMSDAAESINAAVAGSVILYEAYRQKSRL